MAEIYPPLEMVLKTPEPEKKRDLTDTEYTPNIDHTNAALRNELSKMLADKNLTKVEQHSLVTDTWAKIYSFVKAYMEKSAIPDEYLGADILDQFQKFVSAAGPGSKAILEKKLILYLDDMAECLINQKLKRRNDIAVPFNVLMFSTTDNFYDKQTRNELLELQKILINQNLQATEFALNIQEPVDMNTEPEAKKKVRTKIMDKMAHYLNELPNKEQFTPDMIAKVFQLAVVVYAEHAQKVRYISGAERANQKIDNSWFIDNEQKLIDQLQRIFRAVRDLPPPTQMHPAIFGQSVNRDIQGTAISKPRAEQPENISHAPKQLAKMA